MFVSLPGQATITFDPHLALKFHPTFTVLHCRPLFTDFESVSWKFSAKVNDDLHSNASWHRRAWWMTINLQITQQLVNIEVMEVSVKWSILHYITLVIDCLDFKVWRTFTHMYHNCWQMLSTLYDVTHVSKDLACWALRASVVSRCLDS